ncbi:MAG: glucosidase [Bacteroidetes bacterium]|nr:MAG: glucosidase [Bacteroidota bacterium]
MNAEEMRLQDPTWKKWGPYLSERQWGTVREDYSANGQPWTYSTHEMARSKAWRWGEEGIAGFCDSEQLLCFAVAFWNKKDPIIKEILFGLSNPEGNHGEDVKELYYYLDSTPTHSYMKMLYKYPQEEYPYKGLVEENARRSRNEREYELIDTGIFNDNKYFDLFTEYAKADKEDILIKITIQNQGDDNAALTVLPTLWFRNTWSWGYDSYKPNLFAITKDVIEIQHRDLGNFKLYCENCSELLFCENETNSLKLYQHPDAYQQHKDGINDYIVHSANTIDPEKDGTKAAARYEVSTAPKQTIAIRLRLSKLALEQPFEKFDELFKQRVNEANTFYSELQKNIPDEDARRIQRQAFAGMLWGKQFYLYDVNRWLKGDPAEPAPPPQRLQGRNKEWKHLNNSDVISMPDNWEYPWFAAWDLAFHCITFALIDPSFAKNQLVKLTHEWYMHPNGQLPAYEWNFSDVNPPVHAWAAWRIFELEKKNNNGKGDIEFLQTIFHKLLINFTWWVNRKDVEGNNIFEGGFLGMDNIGLFDRNTKLPDGSTLEQSDGTSWVGMYSLNLMRIALELSKTNPVYEDLASKFFEHFLYIADAMESMGENSEGLWDEEDQFYYDTLLLPDGVTQKLKTRSMVGLIPLFAVEVLDDEILRTQKDFAGRLRWFLDNRPDLASLVSRWHEKSTDEKHLLSLLRGHRMKRILYRMLDENEFLSDFGVRALSKYHLEHPYELNIGGTPLSVNYCPGESNSSLFGGNSNWRGPIWMPVNFLLIESLQRFHHYYGDDFRVEYPTRSGVYYSLNEISEGLTKRLIALFKRDSNGKRAIFGDNDKLQDDPAFNNYLQFFEYFHGDTGRGLGASHQTGWTGLIAKLIHPR